MSGAALAAPAERPAGSYVVVHRTASGPIGNHGGSHILFINGCRSGGCTITPGEDDSRTNHSSIPNGTSHLAAWPYGDDAWNTMMACIRDLYSPFDVQVTDVDPGPDTPHFEAIVAGYAQDVGMPYGVGGVSPYADDCSVIENAITYTFAQSIGNDPQVLCEIVGQESAHAYGLDHEYLCEDPMTYLNGCGPKTFQDQDVRCGEYSERDCYCGQTTQNSYQWIMGVFGPAIPPTPPEVSIDTPADGATLRPGFTISVTASDDVEVARVELWIGGQMIGAKIAPPYEWRAPGDLYSTTTDIEARAYDDRSTLGSDTITVTIEDRCTKSSECDDGQACVDGRCVPYGVTGGLGDVCAEDADCLSGICVEQLGVCTELCDPAIDGCPSNFDCVTVAGGGGACFESDSTDGCGCRVDGRSGLPLAPLALFGLLFAIRRRRR